MDKHTELKLLKKEAKEVEKSIRKLLIKKQSIKIAFNAEINKLIKLEEEINKLEKKKA